MALTGGDEAQARLEPLPTEGAADYIYDILMYSEGPICRKKDKKRLRLGTSVSPFYKIRLHYFTCTWVLTYRLAAAAAGGHLRTLRGRM